PLLLADEPTGNLDSATGRQIIDLLLGVNRSRGTTLVLVTHDPELASVAHMSVALRDGRVASQTMRPEIREVHAQAGASVSETDPGSRPSTSSGRPEPAE